MSLQVWDWRRRTFALYDAVRAEDDPAAAHARWVEGRNAMLTGHPASPVPRGPARPLSRCRRCRLRPGVPVRRPGRHRGRAGDLRVRDRHRRRGVLLADWAGRPRRDRFPRRLVAGLLRRRDLRAGPRRGTSTYGGGRYLLDTVKGADLGGNGDSLVVDLNFAYQPSCAYDPAWACPLAGPGNTLAAELPVGELYRDLTEDGDRPAHHRLPRGHAGRRASGAARAVGSPALLDWELGSAVSVIEIDPDLADTAASDRRLRPPPDGVGQLRGRRGQACGRGTGRRLRRHAPTPGPTSTTSSNASSTCARRRSCRPTGAWPRRRWSTAGSPRSGCRHLAGAGRRHGRRHRRRDDRERRTPVEADAQRSAPGGIPTGGAHRGPRDQGPGLTSLSRLFKRIRGVLDTMEA